MRFALPLLAVVATGCMTTPVQRADTLGQGDFAVGIEPGVSGGTIAGAFGVLPAFNVSGRYGITDKFDMGVRLGSSVYEIQAKVMLTERDSGVPMSLAPATTFAFFGGGGGGTGEAGGGGFFRVKVPLLIGIPVGTSQLVLGPAVTTNVGLGGGVSAFSLGVGSSVGFNAKLSDSFALHPEFGLNYNALAGASGGGTANGGVAFAFTLGLIVGNRPD